jgi:hypothetical protein
MRENPDPLNMEDAPDERPDREGDPSIPTTPPREQAGLALPPAGAVSALKIVVLPQPLSPTSPKISPDARLSETLSSARFSIRP